MNLIFLDCDGVVNNVNTPGRPPGGIKPADPANIAHLNRIVKSVEHCFVVTTSTWRRSKLLALGETAAAVHVARRLAEDGFEYAARMIGATPILEQGPDIGKVVVSARPRHEEIRAWLRARLAKGHEVTSFVVLDDSIDARIEDLDAAGRFIYCDHRTGLTADLATSAVQMLNTPMSPEAVTRIAGGGQS